MTIEQSEIANFATFQEQYLSKYVQLADTKAGVTFVAVSGTMGYLLSDQVFRDTLRYDGLSPEFFCAFAALAVLAISAAFCLLVIVPSDRHSRPGPVFFQSVAAHPDADAYVASVQTMSLGQLVHHRLMHCFDLSAICTRKFGLVRRAIIAAVAGLLLTFNWMLWFQGTPP